MQAAGVFLLNPAKRRAVAKKLEEAGVTDKDVDAILDYLEGSTGDPNTARRVLASILSDPDKAAEGARDVRKWKEAQKPADIYDRNGSRQHHADAPQPGEDALVWEHDRMCRIAHCRVVSDRAPLEVVARELGVKVGTLQTMLDRGRELSKPADWITQKRKVKEDAETPEQRIARFRAQMQEARREQ